ncbi:MAG TPA: FG-GAP-like repeat-containing protein, partial [Blastocatellia bacterium]|nr:FG-GAP-like repeat-containing protein [Blastocatellia bacterium]
MLAAASAAMIISFAVPGIKVRHGAAGPRLLEASEPTPADRQTGLEQSIAAREYEATDAGQGLQAPNRAQGIRTYFEPGGARIVDRETAGDELARVRTVSVGRGAAVRQVDSGEVSADGARVEVRRPGLVESFENTEGGLEHGYTLLDKPDDTGPLSIEIAFDGASARVDDNKATLTTTGGRRFEYGGLAAWDASGAALDSRMEAADDGHVRLVVDDASAAYPITVDPTLTSPAHATLHSDQASANTVGAGAGDVNGDGYDDIIVGSPSYDLGETDEGAVFVFLGGPQGITSGTPASASATLQSDQMGAHFGSPLAGAGDVNGDGYADIIVGANNYSAGQSYEGAAFVFLGGPGGIASGTIATAATTLQSDQIDAAMGSAVAGAGDVNGDGYADVIVGALGYDGDGATDEGAAFVFVGGPSGVSSGSPATAYATLQSDQTSAFMGDSVAGAGDVNGDGYADVIVGASFYDHGQTDEGAAFVFLGSQFGILGGNPTSAAAVLESDQINAEMNNVAGAGDVNSDGFADVIVCSNRYSAGQSHEGAAFIFMGSPAGIVSGTPATASATLESDQVDANLGSVTGVGDVNDDGYADVMVGAPYYDADQTDEGAAFVFLGGASGVASGGPSAASSILRCHQSIAYFGSVAGAGDVNGDGYADVIVTAVNYNAGLNAEGAAFVYQGGPFGLEGYPVPAATMQSDQGSAFSGTSVAGAGDVNGDGYADVIVGAPFYDAGQSDEGAAFVFLGGPSGITGTSPSTAASFLQSNQTGAHMGQSVASAGDVNGDGYADVIVGANKYHSGQTDEGAAFVFLGGPNGISGDSPATASAIVESDQMGAQMGYSVAGAGDVNNDGYDDVIVGAFAFVINASDEGEAFIFLGGPSGVASATPATAATTLQAVGSSLLGFSVAGAGDVNGDGYSDVIVGAQYFSNGQTDEGGAFVFLG